MPWDRSIVNRLLGAVVLASVGGLLLLSSYRVRAEAPQDRAIPASLEMMQLLRDEHQLVGDMVKAQLAMADSSFLDPNPITTTVRSQAIALR